MAGVMPISVCPHPETATSVFFLRVQTDVSMLRRITSLAAAAFHIYLMIYHVQTNIFRRDHGSSAEMGDLYVFTLVM